MIRFISFMLGRPYETCKGCEVLKQQLKIANEEKQLMTSTLLDIIKPKVYEAPAKEINAIEQTSALFSRRRAALEAKDRQEAAVRAQSKFISENDRIVGQLTSLEQLETELGINDQEKKEA